MTTLEIQLPESVGRYLELQVAEGRYASLSECVSALVREAQERESRKRQAWCNLEPLVLEGLDSPAREMSSADWLRLHERIEQTVTQADQP